MDGDTSDVTGDTEDSSATSDEVNLLIANAREHTNPDVDIYITGQPLYQDGEVCFLAGDGGPELTDDLAQQAAADGSLNVVYPSTFGPLGPSTVSDGCHANLAGQQLLGNQGMEFFGS